MSLLTLLSYNSRAIFHVQPVASLEYIPMARLSHHQYACTRCRSRKVKCDKGHPTCIYCHEAGVPCIYLARRPRNSLKVPQDAGMKRPLLPTPNDVPGLIDQLRDERQSDGEDVDVVIPREMRDSMFEARMTGRQSDQGRLFVAQGKSRYINPDKARLVESLESVFATSNTVDEEANAQTLANSNASSGINFLLGMSRVKMNLRSYHPSPEMIRVLWDYYVRNVDLLVKIVYKPAVETLLRQHSTDPEGIDSSAESLLFAIYFATVTAMTTEESLRLLKAERSALLIRYRYAFEHALTQAGWMTTQELLVLQALCLYIVCFVRAKSTAHMVLQLTASGIQSLEGYSVPLDTQWDRSRNWSSHGHALR